MLCWGSWANTQKLASKEWRFQLFYWDYSFGILILALVLALTMGSFGTEGRSFIEDLRQADSSMIWSAFIGGIVFNLANILLLWLQLILPVWQLPFPLELVLRWHKVYLLII
jgi:glucose uptake protein